MMQHRFAFLLMTALALGAVACDSSGAPEVDGSAERPVAADRTSEQMAFDSVSPPAGVATPDPVTQGGAPAPDQPTVNGAEVGGASTVADAGREEPASAAAEAAPSAEPQPRTAPASAGGLPANEILDRAEEAYSSVRSMEADFAQRVFVPLLDNTIQSRGKLYHRAPDRFLMRFAEPEGDIILADGRYAWMYYPSTDPRQVMRAPIGQGGQRVNLQEEFLSDASSRFSATLNGTETVGGRQTHALTLRPRGPSPYELIRLWVDADNFLVRRFQITEANETVRTIELSNIRTNVDVPNSLFEFTPPPDAQVIEP